MTGVVRLRLRDHSSGESRHMSIAADSVDEAEAIALAQEAKHVRFMLDPSRAVEFERALREGTLKPADRARLAAHHQDKPYVIQKAKEA